ncbi:MAG: RuBisCO large subunit C-terminal-like domain-containing protein [Anaerolineales bacterium]|nr:RuBisCO large subunit C-terminal-like domain-containing protein [Anaerolineales bacterium]
MPGYRPNTYALLESLESEDYVIGTYLVTAQTSDYMRLAGEVAAEQTTGTCTRVPLETDELMARHGGQVIGAFEVPAYEYVVPEGKRTFVIEVAFPHINFGHQVPMLLTTVIGNISMMGTLKLVDLKMPKSFVDGFPGPKFGVPGMREFLSVPKRPLLNNMIKPCSGLSPEQTGKLFYEVAAGGVDLIKDDELIANTSYSSVAERVRHCMAAEKRAYEETGEHTYYCVNVTDIPTRVLDNVKAALDAGTNMIMLNTLTAGYGTLHMLAADPAINVPILSHPDFSGAIAFSEDSGMSVHLTLGKLLRMCGADVSAYLNPYGKLSLNREAVAKTLFALQAPFYGKKPTWAFQGGGMIPGMVHLMIEEYGTDIVIGAGGGIISHPMGATAGGRAFRQAIDTVLAGKSLREGAKEHKELKAALDAWGVVGEEGQLVFGLKK